MQVAIASAERSFLKLRLLKLFEICSFSREAIIWFLYACSRSY
jgi:hypothetical protein